MPQTTPELHDSNSRRFERIGQTALMTTYWRSFSDIPVSKEVWQEIDRIHQESGAPISDEWKEHPAIAPQLEARYKLIDKLLDQSGLDQVLEVAAGVATRGLNSATKFTNYVELDMPGVIQEKVRVTQRLAAKGKVRPPDNLHFVPGDALDRRDMATAASSLDPTKPIGVINEGLMRYLSFEERAKLASNIHWLLGRAGGAWITPDITMRKVLRDENKLRAQHVEQISQVTGVDIAANRFEDESHARRFFEELGFSIESHSFMEVFDELVSPQALGLSEDETRTALSEAVVFVMKPR